MKYKYLKGSAEDFDGAPEWAALRTFTGGSAFFAESHSAGSRVYDIARKSEFTVSDDGVDEGQINIIAHREPITECTRQDGVMFDAPVGMPLNEFECRQQATASKYTRDCKGVQVDVYDVLQAFDVTNPALQHLIKKALCVGIRGHKTKQQDLQDIIDSAIRAKELESNK